MDCRRLAFARSQVEELGGCPRGSPAWVRDPVEDDTLRMARTGAGSQGGGYQ